MAVMFIALLLASIVAVEYTAAAEPSVPVDRFLAQEVTKLTNALQLASTNVSPQRVRRDTEADLTMVCRDLITSMYQAWLVCKVHYETSGSRRSDCLNLDQTARQSFNGCLRYTSGNDRSNLMDIYSKYISNPYTA